MRSASELPRHVRLPSVRTLMGAVCERIGLLSSDTRYSSGGVGATVSIRSHVYQSTRVDNLSSLCIVFMPPDRFRLIPIYPDRGGVTSVTSTIGEDFYHNTNHYYRARQAVSS